MEDPIKVWELSKDKTGLPVNLCVIDINEDYQDDDYKVSVDDYPSRLIMQNYYDDSDNKELVHISVEKDNPHLFEDELNLKEDDFRGLKYALRKDYETLSMDTISDAINNYNYSIEVINDADYVLTFYINRDFENTVTYFKKRGYYRKIFK